MQGWRSLSLDMEIAAHKLSAVTITRSLLVATAVVVAAATGCKDKAPEPRTALPETTAAVPSRSAADATRWPPGLGRAFALRLASAEDAYRLVVPELGDRRFADSALSVKAGDSIPVVLLGRRGKAGDAELRVIDSEVGTGSCVTWPAVEITKRSFTRPAGAAWWRVAMERDSVTPIAIDSLAAMNAADSANILRAVNSLLPDVATGADSTLRGIPFGILRAYSMSAVGTSIVVAEVVRRSATEADPREQRLFLVGERTRDAQAYQLVHSRNVTGSADRTPVPELLVALVSRRSGRPILVLGLEGAGGTRVQLLQRIRQREWTTSWASAVSFC